jgi:hypothetical protein
MILLYKYLKVLRAYESSKPAVSVLRLSATTKNNKDDNMGVPRLFSRGGQKFSRGGGTSTYFLTKKQLKRYYFSQKSLKTYYFWPAKAGQGGGGQEPPLPPPGDAHG